MKKYFLCLATAILSLGFTACEDVPAPYEIPGEGGNGGGGVVEGVQELPYAEDFNTSFGAFKNFTTSGAGEWIIDFKTAKASGYDNASKTNTAGTYYLVSPEISLANQTEVHMSLKYVWAFAKNNPEGNKVFISDQFSTANPDQNWTEIPVKLIEKTREEDWKDPSIFHTLDIQIPEKYMGKTIRVAFYHNCDDKGSTTWEIKDFKIEAGKAEGGEGGEVTPEPTPDQVKELPYNETFSSTLGAFKSINLNGKGEWIIDFSTAKITNHEGGKDGVDYAGAAMLVSPEISLKGQTAAHVSYEYILRYDKGQENQQFFICENFDEKNPEAGWELLNGTHTEGLDWNTFAKADLAIPAKYMGKNIRVAFRYSSTDTGSSTWEVKNFNIAAGKPGEGGEEVKPDPNPNPQPVEGTPITWESNTEWTSGDGMVSLDKAPYSIVVAKGAESKTPPMVHEKYFEVRAYAFNTVTVSTTDKAMTQVVFNLAKYGDEKLPDFTATTGNVTIDKANMQVIWTGNAKEFTITVGEKAVNGKDPNAYGQFRFRSLVVATGAEA